MVKELDTRCIKDFSSRIKKAVAKNASPSGITVGFEWEIHLRNSTYPYQSWSSVQEDDPNNMFSRAWLSKHGFSGHYDSGGREVGSPIFNNVATARRFASWLQEAAEECNKLVPNQKRGINTGIHVHATDLDKGIFTQCTSQDYHRANDLNVPVQSILLDRDPEARRFKAIERIMDLTLNRYENYDWLWNFSRRQANGSGYSGQAKVNKWDHPTQGGSSTTHMSMVRINGAPAGTPGAADTIENRLWAGVSEVLIPAVEFHHSMFKWARGWVNTVGVDEVLRNTVHKRGDHWRNNLVVAKNGTPVNESAGCVPLEQLDGFAPRMSDYFNWLKAQKGYKQLKADEYIAPQLA